MRVRGWWTTVVLAGVAVACGDQPTEVVPERQQMTQGPGLIALATSSSDDGLSITTDKDDYAPGDTVWFTGAGWPANDTLDILLEDEPATHEPHAWWVPVGEDGTFRDSTYVVDVGDLGVTFTLTATSRRTERWLTVIFTDGNIRIQSNGEGVTFTVTATKYVGSGNCGTGAQTPTTPTIGSSPATFVANPSPVESYKFVAAANSDQSPAAPFVNWTTSDPVVSNVGNTLCVIGFNGNRTYTANYDAAPDLTITKSTSGTFSVGSVNAAYSFQVTNSGNATAAGAAANRITVTDILPAGLTAPASPFTASNWSCTVSGQTVTCQLATGLTIAPAASRTFSFGVGITLAACPSVSNSASVGGGNEPAGNAGNNTSAAVATPISAGCPDPNQAPSADAGDDKEGNEGSAIQLDGSGSTDPDGDTPLEFEWTVVTPLTGFDAGATCGLDDSSIEKPSITCTDDGIVKVTLKVKDSEGLPSANEDEVEVTVKNVKPTVTVSPASKTIDEGGSASFTATVTDEGDNDDPDDFDFDWTTTVGPCSLSGTPTLTSATFSCNDNASGTVKLTVDDGDEDGEAFDEASLTVTNVPPTASGLTTNSPVAEGSDITLSLADVFDPSTVDAASLRYAFDCGDGNGYGTATSYATAGEENDADCPTTDNGARTVKGKVFDKDGGSNEYTESVTITNVPPSIQGLTTPAGGPLPASIAIGATLDIKVTFTDPGSGDTHTAKIDCGTGYGDVDSGNDVASPFQTSCTFAAVGSKTIKVRVADDDGGYDVESHVISVLYNFEGLFAPVDRPNTMNVSKAGQAIPLKWRLTDYQGAPILDFSPAALGVAVTGLQCTVSTTLDQIEEYAGNSGLQNLGDGYYQFNWKTPSSYANSCKAIGLNLGEGSPRGPLAYFNFKK
jgi:uncharacterized repeat protein (TIGR01451 family)